MSVDLITQAQTDWQNKNLDELKKNYEYMAERLEARRATCRKSSKQYYDKTYKLSSSPTAEQIEKNKKTLQRRDNYQKNYYTDNKEKIQQRQKEYRARKKAERLAKKKAEAENQE